jgi:hypothetical protein
MLWLISAGFGIAPTNAILSEVKRPGLIFRRFPPGLPPVRTVPVWRRGDDSPVLKHSRESVASAGHPRRLGDLATRTP